jgi:hypothetical protein
MRLGMQNIMGGEHDAASPAFASVERPVLQREGTSCLRIGFCGSDRRTTVPCPPAASAAPLTTILGYLHSRICGFIVVKQRHRQQCVANVTATIELSVEHVVLP